MKSAALIRRERACVASFLAVSRDTSGSLTLMATKLRVSSSVETGDSHLPFMQDTQESRWPSGPPRHEEPHPGSEKGSPPEQPILSDAKS